MSITKTNSWNSIVFNSDGKITISAKLNGKRSVITYNSIESVIENQQCLPNNSCKWIVAIPDNDCIFKEITLPAANLDEASRMLEYEIPGLVPIDPQDLVFGCYEMSHVTGSYNICVCVIKKILLEKYFDSLKQINIKPDKIIVHSVAIKEAYDNTNECTVIAVNDEVALLIKYTFDQMPVSRYFNVHTKDDFLEEIINYLSSSNAGEKLLVALPQDINLRLKELIKKKGIVVSECLDSGISDKFTEEGSGLSNLITRGAIAICNENMYPNFNLMPAHELRNRARKKAMLSYALNSAVLILLVLLLWLNLCIGNIRLARKIKVINGQIDPIKDIAAQVEAKKIQLNAIKDQINSKGKIIKILDDFYGYTPLNISLNELMIVHENKGLHVQIKGQTQDHPSAFGYPQELKNAACIHDMDISVGHLIPGSEGNSIVEFGAECLIK